MRSTHEEEVREQVLRSRRIKALLASEIRFILRRFYRLNTSPSDADTLAGMGNLRRALDRVEKKFRSPGVMSPSESRIALTETVISAYNEQFVRGSGSPGSSFGPLNAIHSLVLRVKFFFMERIAIRRARKLLEELRREQEVVLEASRLQSTFEKVHKRLDEFDRWWIEEVQKIKR